ncbi:MAG TPA: DUF3021 domain-containing protein [Bacillota bacterium]|nr:DUF3021 domain-containing protein [Bacillota bacterium]
MKNQSNNMALSIISAIGFAFSLFCLAGIIFDLANKGSFHFEDYNFTKMALGALVIGLGFGIPTFIYGNERLSLPMQTLIHMGIGCIVMTATAFAVGWMPTEKGALAVALAILSEIAAAFGIWLAFYLNLKKIAEKMNKRISEMNER